VSKRESVLAAVKSLIAASLPAAEVKRNQDKPERIPPGGIVIVRDGDPGDPEYTLSPLAYTYTHRIPLDVAAFASQTLTREQALDQMLIPIGEAIAADPTLGGLCDFAECEAPETDDLETEGARSGRWASTAVLATYTTSNPLG
jgi:hypothetical protein